MQLPGIGQPIDYAAMAKGQGLWSPDTLAQGLQLARGQGATLGNPEAVQAQQQANLAQMMEAYKRAQSDQALGAQMMQPEYVRDSGGLGALAMIAQAAAGRRISRLADEKASDYAGRVFAEQQRMEQEQAAAAQAAKLAEEERAFGRQLTLEQEKGRIRNERMPESIRALEVLSQRPDLAALDLERKIASAARTTVNTGNYQRPFEAELAKNDAQAYGALRDQAGSAQQALNSIDALDAILSNAQTGKMNEALAMAGQYFGTEAGADFQAANALVQERVVDLMGQLKGPATDQDAARLAAIIPNMGTDPRARKVVFDFLRKQAA